MPKQKLPTPATGVELFMAAVVEELQDLNANLKKLTKIIDEATTADTTADTLEPNDEVDLKEPAVADTLQDADAPVTVETVETVPPVAAKPKHRDAKKEQNDADSLA